MAELIDPKQQHLDDHYGDMDLNLVKDAPVEGKGFSASEAVGFLKRLRPRRATLGDAVKKKG